MKCEDVKIHIPELIDGKLDETIRLKISSHINSCDSCSETYTEMEAFLKFTDSFGEIEPPKGMKDEFLMMAEMQGFGTKTRHLIIPDWAKAAAMIIVVLSVFAAGYFTASNNTENNQLLAEVQTLKQQVVLAGLQDYSGPQKIEAVYSISQNEKTSNDVVSALISTLNSDKNINVRLAALSVLSEMVSTNETVKMELINSLLLQENPLVQISLIQALTESGIKEAKKNIELITNKKDIDPNVKDYAQNMIKTII